MQTSTPLTVKYWMYNTIHETLMAAYAEEWNTLRVPVSYSRYFELLEDKEGREAAIAWQKRLHENQFMKIGQLYQTAQAIDEMRASLSLEAERSLSEPANTIKSTKTISIS